MQGRQSTRSELVDAGFSSAPSAVPLVAAPQPKHVASRTSLPHSVQAMSLGPIRVKQVPQRGTTRELGSGAGGAYGPLSGVDVSSRSLLPAVTLLSVRLRDALPNTSDKLRPRSGRQPSSVCWAAWSRSCPSGARPPRPAFLVSEGFLFPQTGAPDRPWSCARPQSRASRDPRTPDRSRGRLDGPCRALARAEVPPPDDRSAPTGADRRSGGGQSRPKLDLISGCASSRIAGRAFKPNRPP